MGAGEGTGLMRGWIDGQILNRAHRCPDLAALRAKGVSGRSNWRQWPRCCARPWALPCPRPRFAPVLNTLWTPG